MPSQARALPLAELLSRVFGGCERDTIELKRDQIAVPKTRQKTMKTNIAMRMRVKNFPRVRLWVFLLYGIKR